MKNMINLKKIIKKYSLNEPKVYKFSIKNRGFIKILKKC